MRFWIEWAFAVHRAIWFPMNWTLGLERPGIEMPAEFAPVIAGGIDPPQLTVIQGGRGGCDAGCGCTKHRTRAKAARKTKKS